MSFVYRQAFDGMKIDLDRWQVGHYNPKTGNFHIESSHDHPDDAAQRVRYLNGGDDKYWRFFEKRKEETYNDKD